jgi:raffinose synthase
MDKSKPDHSIVVIVLLLLVAAAAHGQNTSRSSVQLTNTIENGVLRIATGAGPVLSNLKLRLRVAPDQFVSGDLQLVGKKTGSDDAGTYDSFRYRFTAGQTNTTVSAINAVLELRHYAQPETIIAFLEYDGPPLAARDGVQLLMGLDAFERGMATKRLKLYWTSPAFVSDYRLLGPANQLFLWKQTHQENYHLLVPLAGDGLIGEVGVSEIDYRYEFRISSSSYDASFSPKHVPLFAYSTSNDPYALTRKTYELAFAATKQYGKLRWQKDYPEIFSSLGWCSWNAFGHEVSEAKILSSVKSLQEKQIPLGFVLVDDGWLRTKDNKLIAFNADPKKFPNDLSGLATTLRQQLHVPHIGVWHTFQGYWNGVDADSEIGRRYRLFKGLDNKSLPDPRNAAGETFYADWYKQLRSWGFDFVKVDGQGNNIKFTNTLMPLFVASEGEHKNFQEAARKYFSDGRKDNAGLNVINCMEMSVDNTYNWSLSNVARNSDDYLPDNPQNAKEHIYQNAYNSFWTSNFAYPDWDMFQSHDPNAEYHAIARAISGGPIYITDQPGKEKAEIIRRLATSDAKLLMPDEPGQVTRDILMTDVALEPVALKVFGRVSRPGFSSAAIAVFNVNKSASRVAGSINREDIEGWDGSTRSRVAVYERSSGRVTVLDDRHPSQQFTLTNFGFDLYTLSPVTSGIAVFGLLDKYLGSAAIVSQLVRSNEVTISLREAGDFGAWLEQPPAVIKLDGRVIPSSSYSYKQGLLRIPKSSFTAKVGPREVVITLRRART